ncbi:MAG: hypothetical protein R2710_24205 [Acidimicrobiales bacterium]
MAHVLVQFLLYPGVQPLDFVGPHEVFEGRTAGWRGTVPAPSATSSKWSARCRPVAGESGLVLFRRVLGRFGATSTSHTDGPGWGWGLRGPPRRRARRLVPAGRSVGGADHVGLYRRLPAGRGRAARRSKGDHPLESGRTIAAGIPEIDVDPDPIFLRDGNVWTSAG